MKIAALALAPTIALVVGCAQPVFAQTQDQTGVGNQNYMRDRSDMGRSGATTGANSDEQNGNWNDAGRDRDRHDWRRDHRGNGSRMGMGMGPTMMWRWHEMMNALGGAQFHFARGKARMDIRCPAQGNLQACVHAATELLDKIAQLRHGGENTTGPATGGEEGDRTNGSGLGQQSNPRSGSAMTPDTANPHEPRPPGEHM